MGFLVAGKNEEDPIKTEGARVVTTLFIVFSDAQGQLTPKSLMEILPRFKLIRAFNVGLITCKNEKDPSKMKVLEWSQHFSHYKSMGIFQDAQGQLTHKSLVQSCQILNPFESLWLSSLPARIKNQLKMKEQDWSQDFPHYNPMRAICCHGNQSSNPILPKT